MKMFTGRATTLAYAKQVKQTLEQSSTMLAIEAFGIVSLNLNAKKVKGTSDMYEGISVNVTVDTRDRSINHSVAIPTSLLMNSHIPSNIIDSKLEAFLQDVLTYLNHSVSDITPTTY